ncbi:MAG: Hsp20 family protein [Rhodospirillales bacterium]|nr:Hsp20 family protein [Rhodospirillales bacterium]
MRNLDFSPLFRSTIGFDRIQNMLDSASRLDEASASYPPYNIEALSDTAYQITMAVAGFGEDDIEIVLKENTLTVSGKIERDETPKTYLHHGIAGRSFERRFQLADHIEIKGASLVNGLLNIDLERVVPEELKPRQIKITSGTPKAKVLEGKKAA